MYEENKLFQDQFDRWLFHQNRRATINDLLGVWRRQCLYHRSRGQVMRARDDWQFTGFHYTGDEWHHIALVKNDTNKYLCFDTALEADTENIGTPMVNPFRLGRQYGGHTENIHGRMDDLTV